MANHHKVDGYTDFQSLLSSFKPNEEVVILFCGSPDDSGVSWCPDCVAAEPLVQEVLKENEKKKFHFVEVFIGSREEWRNPQCPFRTDNKVKLSSVPTLMKWGDVQRLNDEECQNKDNIRMIFEDL